MNFPLLVFFAFASSAAGLVVEIVAGRMLAPFYGMSLQTWTIIISIVLLGFSVGQVIGGRYADLPPELGWRKVSHAMMGAALTTLAAETLVRMTLGLPFGDTASMLIAAGVFFPPSFFIATASPLVTKAAVEIWDTRQGRALGIIYGAGSIGAIVGSVGAGFALVPMLGSSATIISTAALYCVLATLALTDAHRRLGDLIALVTIGAIIAAFSLGMTRFMDELCDVESEYYCIRLEHRPKEGGVIEKRLILNQLLHASIRTGELQTDLPIPYVNQLSLWVNDYVRSAGPDQPIEAFFIGGGGYTLPTSLVREHPEMRAVVAEIDPQVTQFVEERIPEIDLSPLTIIHHDGRRVLRSMERQSLDLVILDAFADVSIPEHLATWEFFQEIAQHLADNGLVLINVIDDHSEPALVASIVRTAKDHFPAALISKQRLEPSRPRLINYVIALSRSKVDLPSVDEDMHLFYLTSNAVSEAPVQTDDRSNANLL